MSLDDLLDATEHATWEQLHEIAAVCIARMMDLSEGSRHELDRASGCIVRAGIARRDAA